VDGVNFLNIAHRGFSAAAPENTVAAFEKAIEAGADMLEMDALLTADGEVVVIHDHRVGRTTDGTGLVKDLSYDYIRSLDAGKWFGREFKSERVPLLEEVLDLARRRAMVDIEMKFHRRLPVRELVDKCARIVEKHGMKGEVILSSFALEALAYLHRKAPSFRFAPICRRGLRPTSSSFPVLHGADGVVLNHLFVTRTTVARCHDLGIRVFVYTVNAPRKIEKMVKIGVDGVISDNPAVVNAVLGRILGKDSKRGFHNPAG
jgi:glycerophosphoryl diester phosphodiesterase